MTIKTIQWNIGGGKIKSSNPSLPLSKQYSIDGLTDIEQLLYANKPNIVSLQETHTNSTLSQAQTLATTLNFSCINDPLDQSHIEADQELGQAILSNFPIKNHTFQLFDNPNFAVVLPKGTHLNSHNKGLTTAEIVLPNKKTLLVLTLQLLPLHIFGIDAQSLQAKPVLHNVETLICKSVKNADHFLVQGDFNFDCDSLIDILPGIFAAGVHEVPLASPTTPRGRKSDHIIYKGLKLVSSTIETQIPTDHYPVSAEFTLD